MKLSGFCLTDTGLVRQKNEDSAGFFPDLGVFVVADGMGGHVGGKQASDTAVRTIAEVFSTSAPGAPAGERLLDSVREANRRIFAESSSEPDLRGMGTTLTALHFDLASGAALVHVGDSRAYRVRDGRVEQLTRDHSLVADLVRRGELSEAEARQHPYRHTLTRALGVAQEVAPEVRRVEIHPGDLYVLASDGAYGMIAEDSLQEILVRRQDDPEGLCRELIAAANSAGGKDNSTVIAVRCSDD